MNDKILGSTQQGITRNSSHQISMNGEIVVKGGSSNITQHNPSCNIIGYSQNNKSSNNKLEEDFAMMKQEKESMHDEFLDSSNPFKKQAIDHSSQAPQENTKKLKYLRNCDQRKVKVINNFSNFLVPKVFLKSTTQPLRNETFEKIEEIEVEKGSKGIKGYEKLSLDDENSEADAILRAKGKAKSSLLCDEPLLSSSPVWSLEASNDPKIMKYEDNDESTYSTRDNDEETEDVVAKETPTQEGNSVKRKETYNLCEKNHREIMNKKMRILKELIPNCNKVDKASLLDDAIDYVKSLKLQLQIMSMGNGLCMPQMMLPQLMGFSFRPNTAINPWTPHQLPIPSLSNIKDNNTLENMFGSFSNQMLQMPTIPHHVPNFMPMMIGNNSSVQQLMPNINMLKHHANSSLTTLDVSDLHAKAELCDTNHAPFNHIPSYYPF